MAEESIEDVLSDAMDDDVSDDTDDSLVDTGDDDDAGGSDDSVDDGETDDEETGDEDDDGDGDDDESDDDGDDDIDEKEDEDEEEVVSNTEVTPDQIAALSDRVQRSEYALQQQRQDEVARQQQFSQSQDYQDFLKFKEGQKAEAEKKEKPNFSIGPDGYDPSLAGKYIVKDEEGNATWRADTPHEIRNEHEQYTVAWEQFQRDFKSNPHEAMRAHIEYRAGEIVDKRMEENRQQQEHQYREQSSRDFVSQFEVENQEWIYQSNEDGSRAFDTVSGRPALSSLGSMLLEESDRLMRSGVTDKQVAIEYAYDRVRQYVADSQQGAVKQETAGEPPKKQTSASNGRSDRRDKYLKNVNQSQGGSGKARRRGKSKGRKLSEGSQAAINAAIEAAIV